jgi:hypothetical protein
MKINEERLSLFLFFFRLCSRLGSLGVGVLKDHLVSNDLFFHVAEGALNAEMAD